MRKLSLSSVLMLALLSWSAGDARAQIGEFCGSSFMSACANLRSITISGASNNVMILEFFHSSDPSASVDIFPDSYIGTILLKFSDSAPDVLSASVTIGGSDAGWQLKNNVGSQFGVSWDEKISKQGGSSVGILAQQTAFVEITFDGTVSIDDLDEWGVQIRSIGSAANCPKGAQECSDWAVVPEPVTLVLLGSGLAGVGGAAALRRRRRGIEIETE